MKKIEAVDIYSYSDKTHFDPYSQPLHGDREAPEGVPVCVCGFELVPEDTNGKGIRMRCSGGNHVYNFDDPEAVVKDKFGSLMLKIPEDVETNENEQKQG